MKTEIEGIYTALVTPFDRSGTGIDESLLKKLIERQVEAKVAGVLLGASTGEGNVLTRKEKERLLSVGLEFQSQLQVIASCGSFGTEQTIEQVTDLVSYGVKTILFAPSPYSKPPQRGLIKHYEMVCQSAPAVSFIIYNIPGRASINILPETIRELWKIPNLVAIKESSGSVEQILQIRAGLPPKKVLLSGDDPLNLSLFAIGARGSVSVLSNVFPKALVHLWNLWKSKQNEEAEKLQVELTELTSALFVESNPIPVKWAVGEILKQELNPRLPLVPLDRAHHEKLKKALENFKRQDLR